MKDLSAAEREAIQHELHGGTLKGLAKEVESSKTFYETESVRDGRKRTLFDGAGNLVEDEEQIAFDRAPAAVRTALSARGKILRLARVTQRLTRDVRGGYREIGKKAEVAVDGDGKPLKP